MDRFSLLRFFERILVSDAIEAAQPAPAAYRHVVDHVHQPNQALFVDDQLRNLDVAAHLGLNVVHASSDDSWVATVDDTLGTTAPSR